MIVRTARRFRGFGDEDIGGGYFMRDDGTVYYPGNAPPPTKLQVMLGVTDKLAVKLDKTPTVSTDVKVNIQQAIFETQAKKAFEVQAALEALDPADPNSPHHQQWLAYQVKQQKKEKLVSNLKVGGAVGGGLLALFLVFALIKRKKVAA